MLRRAVLGLAALAVGCTQEIVLDDVVDGGNRDASPVKDGAPFGGNDWGCQPKWAYVDYMPRSAQMIVALDRSSAMQTALGSDRSRQAAAESALMNAISTYQSRVEFGFEQFPADNTDKAYSDCQHNSCCAGSVKQPSINAYSSISGPLQCGGPGFPCPSASDETASYAALQKIRDWYKSHPAYDDRYVLLVTASEPYCSSLPGSDACDGALSAATDLGDNSARLVVLSVGYQPASGSCLVALSKLGSKQPAPTGMKSLYTPSSVGSLNNEVNDIAHLVAETACTWDSNDTPPPDGAKLEISLGYYDVPPSDPTGQNGWSFANSARTSITLSGDACDNFLTSQAWISAGYSCSECGDGPPCPWM